LRAGPVLIAAACGPVRYGRPRRSLVGVVLLAALGHALPLQGQPALQNAVLTDRGIAARQEARSEGFTEVEGVEVGPVRFSASASYSLEFNDNVNASETDPEGDLIQQPSLNLSIAAPVSERADLAFQFGLGYQMYWHNEDLSSLTIAPDSELAYDLQVKDLFLTLFDRITYTEDVSTAPDIADQAKFPRLNNTVGMQATWLPGHWLLTGGYAYQIYHSTSDEFDYVNQTSHLPFLRAGYVLGSGAANAGLEFSVTLTDYESNTNSDTTIVSFGPYLDWQLSEAMHATLHGGYVYAVNSLTFLPDESFDASSFYLGLDVEDQLTDHISQQLAVGHGVRPSVEQGAALTEETGFNYQVLWSFTDPAALGLDVGYLHGEQSAAAGLAPSEIYDQWRFGLNLSYAWTARLSSSLAYALVVRNSDLPDRDYTQSRMILGLSYRFE